MCVVTEMLVAVLNTCSKEELDESEEEEEPATPSSPSAESMERRKIIKNKILAVGRISRVFSLLRSVSFLQCDSADIVGLTVL